MRKLASIQLIKSLETIEGAEAIEKATVLGWQLVIRKIDAVVHLATVRSALRADTWAEGIATRPLTEKIDLLLSNENFSNGRITFKAINPEFLLKYGE